MIIDVGGKKAGGHCGWRDGGIDARPVAQCRAAILEMRAASMQLRLGASEADSLVVQGNIARTYSSLGRHEDALRMSRDMYSGFVKLRGEDHEGSLGAACNYAVSLFKLEGFDEAKSLMHKTIPVARRILGESNDLTLRMRPTYAAALANNPGVTLDDLREAVTTLEDTERIARRVLGCEHPTTTGIEGELEDARVALRARETPPPPATE